MIINRLFKKLFQGLLLCLVCFVAAMPATAANEQITVHDFVLYQGDTADKLVADLRFDYQLGEHLRKSLLNGITLRNEISFELIFHRDWWWNKREPLESIVSELKYNALTGQYQLVNRSTDKNWNFSNLAAALQHMGNVDNYPLPALPAKALAEGADAAIYVEATLEPRASKTLGVPARISALFSGDESKLTSQGVMWPLTP
ncbi:MAG: DUF4390 domain-containing protein [Thiolinea sp.]